MTRGERVWYSNQPDINVNKSICHTDWVILFTAFMSYKRPLPTEQNTPDRPTKKRRKTLLNRLDQETKMYSPATESCHEILRCQKCLVWRNRDRNAAENIRNLLVLTLKGQVKPLVFQRGTKAKDVYGPHVLNVPTPASFWSRYRTSSSTTHIPSSSLGTACFI